MHPLVAHSLDVAAVAILLPDAERLRIDRRTLGLLVALHDIGKISRAFQAQVPELWPAKVLGPFAGRVASFPHDAMGLYLLTAAVREDVQPLFLADARGRYSWFNPILQAIAGHHGRPAALVRAPSDDELGREAVDAAREFVDSMRAVFRAPPLACPGRDRAVERLGWQLAGLVTLADWIGSRQQWFPYVDIASVEDLDSYFWNHAVPQAAAAIQAAGLGPAPVAPSGGAARLFNIAHPSPVQSWAEAVELPTGPALAVIEDLTGSGKTEAALILAHRIMRERQAGGLFLALPTMATAGAMFGRLADAYHRLFATQARPSLALAHGRAVLDPRFRAAIARDEVDRGVAPADPADESSEAHCAAWLADDRRRALLAQVGVGTIDQALMAVLPVRHAVLRQRGLAGKVLIVDEAHAFDAYMTRELQALLRFHAALGGSAILLSATLPHALRQTLVDAFCDGLETPRAAITSTAYPLVTMVGGDGIAEAGCAPRTGLPRRVAVSRLPSAKEAIARIIAAAGSGAAVAWIRNTVDEAIEAVEMLRAEGLNPLLFHARFAMSDRLRIEEEVLRRFGRNGDEAQRSRVLVATQVVEQSLDLDFDLLCTDLAPMDLLIQRAGRLWRHARGPRVTAGPEMLVVSPEPVAEPAEGWLRDAMPGTAAVYRDPALLWRTARTLFARGAIVTPDDMRPLIEAAADRESEGSVPPALARAAEAAEGKARSAAGIAAQNVLDPWKGYRREHGAWEPDTLTPTRLEDRETVTLRLAMLRDGSLMPYADDCDLQRAWALSEVSVAQHHVAACPVPAGLGAAAEVARAGWGRWERESPRVLLAILEAAHDVLTLSVQTDAGALRRFIYSANSGFILREDKSPGTA